MVIDAFTEICDAHSALKLLYSYSSLVKPWNRWIHWDGCPSPDPLREIKRIPFFGFPRRNQSNHRSFFQTFFEMVDVLGYKNLNREHPRCEMWGAKKAPPASVWVSCEKSAAQRLQGPAKSLRFPRCLGHPTEGGNWSLATVLGSPEIGKHPVVLWGKKTRKRGAPKSQTPEDRMNCYIGMISGWEPTFLPLCFSKYVLFSFLSGGSRRRGQGCTSRTRTTLEG